MVKFIKQEAEEKANEIAVSAEEVYSAIKRLLNRLQECIVLGPQWYTAS